MTNLNELNETSNQANHTIYSCLDEDIMQHLTSLDSNIPHSASSHLSELLLVNSRNENGCNQALAISNKIFNSQKETLTTKSPIKSSSSSSSSSSGCGSSSNMDLTSLPSSSSSSNNIVNIDSTINSQTTSSHIGESVCVSRRSFSVKTSSSCNNSNSGTIKSEHNNHQAWVGRFNDYF